MERAEAQHTAARAKILSVFAGQHGYEADGYYGAASWLRARAKVTRAAAGAATAWTRRLAAHPVIAAALAQGQITASLARQICDGTGRLPEATAATPTPSCWPPRSAGPINTIWGGWRGR